MVDKLSRAGRAPGAQGGAGAEKLSLGFVREAEPHLDVLTKGNPGVLKFLEANQAALHRPKAGDVRTAFDWPLWTHSPRSSGGAVTDANQSDVIVIWQSVPGSTARVDFGNGMSFPGEIIGVHQVNLRDGKVVKPGLATDNGYLWPSMDVIASGPKSAAVTMQWAVVHLDPNGKALSGGYPGGWAGRTFVARHGTTSAVPLPN